MDSMIIIKYRFISKYILKAIYLFQIPMQQVMTRMNSATHVIARYLIGSRLLETET